MKKITFFLTTALLTSALAPFASADTYIYVPYVGADYIYDQVKAQNFSPYHHAFNVRLGSEYGEYFATEIFFAQSGSNSRHVQAEKIKTSYRAYGLDGLAYFPIDRQGLFSLAATVGIGEYRFKTKYIPTKHKNTHGYGYRIGGGFKYMWNKHWQTRVLARYVNFDHTKLYDHAAEYSVGVEYHF